MPSILVLGAGELGLPVLRGLVKYAIPSTTISVLLRPSTISASSGQKADEVAEIRALGVSLVPGDLLTSVPELVEVFKPFHTIIGCTGFVAGRGTQLKLARAVLDAGVARYVPWQFGVDYDVIGRGSGQDLFDEQLDVRDLLRDQESTKWVIVSTGMFTSFLFEPYFGVVEVGDKDSTTVRALGSWDTSVTLTCPEDIGDLTSRILFEDPPFENALVFIAGDTISYGQLAEIVEKFRGKVKREAWDVEMLARELLKDPDNTILKYRLVFAKGTGVSWDTSKTYNGQKGIKTVEVETWVQEKWNPQLSNMIHL